MERTAHYVPGLPFPLTPSSEDAWTVDPTAGTVTATAAAHSDIFIAPDAEPMIVSVVARGVSDDANAFVVDGHSVWLRVSRVDHAFAYHASLDGGSWRMIRFFTIDDVSSPASIGFEAQSPTGDGCTVAFVDIRFEQQRLGDLRDGS